MICSRIKDPYRPRHHFFLRNWPPRLYITSKSIGERSARENSSRWPNLRPYLFPGSSWTNVNGSLWKFRLRAEESRLETLFHFHPVCTLSLLQVQAPGPEIYYRVFKFKPKYYGKSRQILIYDSRAISFFAVLIIHPNSRYLFLLSLKH